MTLEIAHRAHQRDGLVRAVAAELRGRPCFFFLGSGSLFNGHADPGTHMPGYKTPYPDAHPASRRPRPARGTPARRSHTPRGQSKTATLPLTWPACDRTGAHARPQEYGRTVSPPPVTHGAGVMWEGRGPEKGDRVVSRGCPREREKKRRRTRTPGLPCNRAERARSGGGGGGDSPKRVHRTRTHSLPQDGATGRSAE